MIALNDYARPPPIRDAKGEDQGKAVLALTRALTKALRENRLDHARLYGRSLRTAVRRWMQARTGC